MNINDAVILRAGRYGSKDRSLRIPELEPLKEKSVALFGLGCIGAPSALEFARSGVSKLWLIDHDTVDPATTVRWPLGLTAAGIAKVDALAGFIDQNYPDASTVATRKKVGAPRVDLDVSEDQWIDEVLSQASLVYDATAERGVQHYLSDLARRYGVPYVACSSTRGGWGGEVIRISPESTAGCWTCLMTMYSVPENHIPSPPEDPNGSSQPAGCGDPTFRAASFDILPIAATGVRAAVSTLVGGTDQGYPVMTWDGTIISLRDPVGRVIAPKFDTFSIEAVCSRCRPKSG